MRVLAGLLVFGIIVAVAAWATRPGMDAFDAELKDQIQTKIATTDIGSDGNPLATLALVGCKLRPSDCFGVIRQSIDVVMEDRMVFTRFAITGFGRDATCTGAFTGVWCSKGVLDD